MTEAIALLIPALMALAFSILLLLVFLETVVALPAAILPMIMIAVQVAVIKLVT